MPPDLDKQIAEHRRQLVMLMAQANRDREHLSTASEQIAHLEDWVRSLEHGIREKDAAIAELTAELQHLERLDRERGGKPAPTDPKPVESAPAAEVVDAAPAPTRGPPPAATVESAGTAASPVAVSPPPAQSSASSSPSGLSTPIAIPHSVVSAPPPAAAPSSASGSTPIAVPPAPGPSAPIAVPPAPGPSAPIAVPPAPGRAASRVASPNAGSVSAASSPRDEARRHERKALYVEVELAGETNFFVGFSQNVSAGGLFVATYDTLPCGSQIRLTFTLPTHPREISSVAEVMWVREFSPAWDLESDSLPGMGLRFLDISDEDRRAITRFTQLREPIFFPDE